jgi:hypothetical protein
MLKQGDISLWHAQRSLNLCLEKGFAGFDLAFGTKQLPEHMPA